MNKYEFIEKSRSLLFITPEVNTETLADFQKCLKKEKNNIVKNVDPLVK